MIERYTPTGRITPDPEFQQLPVPMDANLRDDVAVFRQALVRATQIPEARLFPSFPPVTATEVGASLAEAARRTAADLELFSAQTGRHQKTFFRRQARRYPRKMRRLLRYDLNRHKASAGWRRHVRKMKALRR